MRCASCGSEMADGAAFCSACGAPRPVPTLVPAFAEAEQAFARARQQHAAGELDDAAFTRAAEALMVDHDGRYWMIGAESGRWYVHDGQAWTAAEPPRLQAGGAAPRKVPSSSPGWRAALSGLTAQTGGAPPDWMLVMIRGGFASVAGVLLLYLLVHLPETLLISGLVLGDAAFATIIGWRGGLRQPLSIAAGIASLAAALALPALLEHASLGWIKLFSAAWFIFTSLGLAHTANSLREDQGRLWLRLDSGLCLLFSGLVFAPSIFRGVFWWFWPFAWAHGALLIIAALQLRAGSRAPAQA